MSSFFRSTHSGSQSGLQMDDHDSPPGAVPSSLLPPPLPPPPHSTPGSSPPYPPSSPPSPSQSWNSGSQSPQPSPMSPGPSAPHSAGFSLQSTSIGSMGQGLPYIPHSKSSDAIVNSRNASCPDADAATSFNRASAAPRLLKRAFMTWTASWEYGIRQLATRVRVPSAAYRLGPGSPLFRPGISLQEAAYRLLEDSCLRDQPGPDRRRTSPSDDPGRVHVGMDLPFTPETA